MRAGIAPYFVMLCVRPMRALILSSLVADALNSTKWRTGTMCAKISPLDVSSSLNVFTFCAGVLLTTSVSEYTGRTNAG